MKTKSTRFLPALAALALLSQPLVAQARTHFNISLDLGTMFWALSSCSRSTYVSTQVVAPVVYTPQPVVYAPPPPPVVYTPQPVVYAPPAPPVVYAPPAPVVYVPPAPVIYRPAPVVYMPSRPTYHRGPHHGGPRHGRGRH